MISSTQNEKHALYNQDSLNTWDFDDWENLPEYYTTHNSRLFCIHRRDTIFLQLEKDFVK